MVEAGKQKVEIFNIILDLFRPDGIKKGDSLFNFDRAAPKNRGGKLFLRGRTLKMRAS